MTGLCTTAPSSESLPAPAHQPGFSIPPGDHHEKVPAPVRPGPDSRRLWKCIKAYPFPTTEIYITGIYTYMVKATESVRSVRPGKTGSQFCYTDRSQTIPLCNNLVTGQRTVPSGYDLGVVFTEPGTKQDRSVLP